MFLLYCKIMKFPQTTAFKLKNRTGRRINYMTNIIEIHLFYLKNILYKVNLSRICEQQQQLLRMGPSSQSFHGLPRVGLRKERRRRGGATDRSYAIEPSV